MYYFLTRDSDGVIVAKSEQDTLTPQQGESKRISSDIAVYYADSDFIWDDVLQDFKLKHPSGGGSTPKQYYFIVEDATSRIVYDVLGASYKVSDTDSLTPQQGETKVSSTNADAFYAPKGYYWDGSDFKGITPSNIEKIDIDWQKDYVDFKVARNQMAVEMSNAGGFNSLSIVDKRIASKWFIVQKSDRDTVHTYDEQVWYANNFYDKYSVEARKKRYEAARMVVFNKLSVDDAKETLVEAEVLIQRYISGIEGTIEDNGKEGLFDYIEARSGTSYATTGLAAKGYVPIVGTLSGLVTELMDILKNGNY